MNKKVLNISKNKSTYKACVTKEHTKLMSNKSFKSKRGCN